MKKLLAILTIFVTLAVFTTSCTEENVQPKTDNVNGAVKSTPSGSGI